MGFRDDHDAALQRAEALQHDLTNKDRELEDLKAQLKARDRNEKAIESALPPKKLTVARIVGGVSILAVLGELAVIATVLTQWATLLETARERLIASGREANYDLVVIHNHVDIIVMSVMALALAYLGVGLLRGRRWAATGSMIWGCIALAVLAITFALGLSLEGSIEQDALIGVVTLGFFPLALIAVAAWLRQS